MGAVEAGLRTASARIISIVSAALLSENFNGEAVGLFAAGDVLAIKHHGYATPEARTALADGTDGFPPPDRFTLFGDDSRSGGTKY